MTLEEIKAYWKDWVSRKEQEGDLFGFLDGWHGDVQGNDGGDQEDQANRSTDIDDEDQQDKATSPPPVFSIDEGLLPPILCNTGPSERTNCLLSLVSGKNQSFKVFKTMVNLVDTMEVSCIKYGFYYISWNFRIWTFQASTVTPAGAAYFGHGTLFTSLKKFMGTGRCLKIS